MTKLQAGNALGKTKINTLQNFIGKQQLVAIGEAVAGDEAPFFADKLEEIYTIVTTMPKTYETEGNKNPLAYLHYFLNGFDWYIFERDMENEQLQAFGWSNLNDDLNAELGYISIKEILKNSGELDLHFEPATLSNIRAKGK